ncbi:MAG: C4-dicarboxylate ABC transporter [Betaproteobacteria bacterium HGW-Betaproteobacteria-9]|jgi:C4-dicarboxylate-binding protein DctP|nr:MAG: C4-dicarboxylate ABC transporter [Betaproteobacteria bacterium HGW-Betaproteobacteria-9]
MRHLPRPTISRRLLLSGCAAAGVAALSPAARSAPGPLRIRFSHVVSEDTPKGLTALRLQALVAQWSGGRMAVEVYPGAQLYGDDDEFEALQTGAVDLLAPSLSKFGRVGFPEFEVFDLPFLFDNLDEVRRVTQGAFGRRLLAGLHRQGLVGLGFFDNGFKHMSADRPLREVSDFQNLRLRVQSSRVIAAQMHALGARPVPLPFSATRDALALGIVQGTENPLSNFWTQGMHEVQPHLSLTRHGYLGYAVITSERFWSRLPAANQRLLRTALDEAIAFGNRITQTQHDKALASLRAWGRTTIHEPSTAQRANLARAVEPVYAELGRRIGAAWIEDVRRAIHV